MPPTDDHSSTSVNTRAPLGFFDLPAEVRNIIYRLLFPREPFSIRISITDTGTWFTHTNKPANILRVSKAFNIEATPFFYSPNQFDFVKLYDVLRFINRIGKQNAAYLTILTVDTFSFSQDEAYKIGWEYGSAFELTAKYLSQRCPQLESLMFNRVRSPEATPWGPARDWKLKTLEHIKVLVDGLPRLPHVSYSALSRDLYLTRTTMTTTRVSLLTQLLKFYH